MVKNGGRDGNPRRDEIMISMGSLRIWGHCCSANVGPHKSLCQQKLKHCSRFSSVYRWGGTVLERESDEIMWFLSKCLFMKLPSSCWPCLGSQQAVGCTSQAGAASATQAHKKMKTQLSWKMKQNKTKKDLMILSPVLIWQGINLLTEAVSYVWLMLQEGFFLLMKWFRKNVFGKRSELVSCSVLKEFFGVEEIQFSLYCMQVPMLVLLQNMSFSPLLHYWHTEWHNYFLNYFGNSDVMIFCDSVWLRKTFFLGKIELIKGIKESKRHIQYCQWVFDSGCFVVSSA